MRGWVLLCLGVGLSSCGGESKNGDAGATGTDAGSTANTSNTSTTASDGTTASATTGSGGTGGSTTSTTSSTSNGDAGGSGGTTTNTSTGAGGTAAGSGGDGGADGGLDCPETAPEDGSGCSIETQGFPSAQCSWGDDPRPNCRTRALCSGGTWLVQEPSSASCEDPPLPAECESEPPDNGSECGEANLECWYGDGTRCTCSPCEGGSGYPVCGQIDPPEWWCTTPADTCDVPLPQAGAPCDDPEASCGHDCALPVVCVDGAWQYGQNGCPICAAPDTPIATPSGEQPIAELRVGDLVYTVEHGAIVAAPLIRVGSTRVHAHRVVRVLLSDGATLEMSPGHPTVDGRTFAELAPGDWLDATHQVVSASLVPFDASHTHDILPASPSGSYFAAGALVASTLGR